jgi:hypothetical protein
MQPLTAVAAQHSTYHLKASKVCRATAAYSQAHMQLAQHTQEAHQQHQARTPGHPQGRVNHPRSAAGVRLPASCY